VSADTGIAAMTAIKRAVYVASGSAFFG
jgi:hypothetical protein